MVEFETVVSKDIRFGNNNFIEVAKKKVLTEDGQNTFFSLARGFLTPDGEKRYKKNFAIPDDGTTLKAVIEAFEELVEGGERQAPGPAAVRESEEESEERVEIEQEEEAEEEE